MPRPPGTPKHRTVGARVGSPRQRGRHASSYGDGFGHFAGVTALALIPGAGLLAIGRRRIGLLLILLAGLGIAVLGAFAVSGSVVERILQLAVSPNQLLLVAVVAALSGAIWCVTILATAWRARPERPSPFQTLVGLVLVTSLCLAVVAPSAKGAQLAMVQRDLVTSVFGSDGTPPRAAGAVNPNSKADNPWQGVPRVNLLLLGSDAGQDRTGVRTDSMMVASINTKTGDTVLIGLPRSLQRVPFPESNPLHQFWPNGFNCGSECLLNAVWNQAASIHPDLFHGNSNPGLTTTRDVISEILGMRLDAYAIIDLRGFQSLVNAMGGVEVNVSRRIPIGGGKNQHTGNELPITGWIEPGRQHLNGYQALWFSRSRSGSDDYDRMRRQRCMVGNLVDQVNPVKLLSKYAQLASVLKNNISTDIPQDQLGAWVTLVQRMQKGKLTSLPLTNKVINTVHPDFDEIRSFVKKAIQPVKAASPAITPTGTATSKTHSPSSTSTPTTESGTAQDVAAVC